MPCEQSQISPKEDNYSSLGLVCEYNNMLLVIVYNVLIAY